jgi:hypothetical protein
MGRHTFEPTAKLDKMIREKIKYKYQEQIGFRICGFKVFDSLAGSYHSVGKRYGRSLTPELVEHGLAAFFHNGLGHFRLNILENLVQKLELLFQWLIKQNKWHFYCSSLLITYDAEGVVVDEDTRSKHVLHRHVLLCCMDNVEEEQGIGGVGSDKETSTTSLPHHYQQATSVCSRRQHDVDVKIIDHAHTLESSGSNDDSYIYSMRSLIRHLKLIILNIRSGNYYEPSYLIADALRQK